LFFHKFWEVQVEIVNIFRFIRPAEHHQQWLGINPDPLGSREILQGKKLECRAVQRFGPHPAGAKANAEVIFVECSAQGPRRQAGF
jgi:hypothetical protein